MQLWLADSKISVTDIGLFSLAQMPYTLKFLWAPVVERYFFAPLGRRRSWMLGTQLLLVLSMISLGWIDPALSLGLVFVVALLLAFASSTQDVVIDAYRRELLVTDAELGLGNSVSVQVYRISGFVPGSLGFILADHVSWSTNFMIMAGFMMVGVITTLLIREAIKEPLVPPTFKEAVVAPFREFFNRRGMRYALVFLAFLFFYKLGDSMATTLSTTFYKSLGFTGTQIGLIAKNAGFWPALIGGMLGGLLIVKIGINKGLWFFGVVQMVTILGFALLAEIGNNPWWLALVIAMEYLGVGLGTAAFVGFIARETSVALAATQFALFTAITSMPRVLTGPAAGYFVETIGWTQFFLLCTVLALPGMLLLLWVAPFRDKPDPQVSQ